jgi:hypothetical protein
MPKSVFVILYYFIKEGPKIVLASGPTNSGAPPAYSQQF